MVKLANGEFFAPQQVEAAFEARCDAVQACALFARPGEAAPVAVVVLQTTHASEATTPDHVLAQMRAAAAAAGLRSWEVPYRVVIDAGPWDEASGCCSAHGKLRRHVIAKRNGLCNAQGSTPSMFRLDGGEPNDETGIVTAQRGTAGSSDSEDRRDRVTLSLPERLLAFLTAPDDAEAASRLSNSGAGAFMSPDYAEAPSLTPVDWFGALGGDSIEATELIALWEREEAAARAGPHSAAYHESGAKPLRVQDVFSLTPWELRRRARARLRPWRLTCALAARRSKGSDGALHNEDDGEDGAEGEEGPQAEEDDPGATPGLPPSAVAFWQQEASAETAAALAAAAAAAAGATTQSSTDANPTNVEGCHAVRGPCVLVTGGTGFLGPHLLSALMHGSSSRRWSTVVALARRPIERVHELLPDANIMASAAQGVAGASVLPRLVVFEADLSMPDLGLSAADRAAIQSMKISVVIHSGAAVDHARPYAALRPTNVAAASALVRLVTACATGNATDAPLPHCPPPLFVHVSTMSVIPIAAAAASVGWDGKADGLVLPACAAALESGYAQSKLVAEHHLASAAGQGDIRLLICRLGLIGAAARSAAVPCVPSSSYAGRRDWLSLLLCAVEAIGASPAGLTSGGRKVGVLPVDLAAATVAQHAAAAFERAVGKAPSEAPNVTIVNVDAMACGVAPRPLSSLLDDIDATRARQMPALDRELPYGVWRRRVASAGPPAALALAMLPPEGRGGALRLPAGARRRLRDMKRRADALESQSLSLAPSHRC